MRALAVVLLGACNEVYGLDSTEIRDAMLVVDASSDRDGDGILNDVDDCPDAPDPAQHDEDGDGVGDACDPCPLDASTAGDDDGDGIDNTCDPIAAGADCLILFDSLNAFAAADWRMVPGTSITPEPDRIRLGGAPRGGLSPASLSGAMSLRVRFASPTFGTNGNLRLMDMAQVNNSDAGYECRYEPSMLAVIGVTTGTPTAPIQPPLQPNAAMIATLAHATPPSPRIDCGLERAAGKVSTGAPITQGIAGTASIIVAVGASVTIDAISIYTPRSGGSCPAPVVR